MKLFRQRDFEKIFPDLPSKTVFFWLREELIEWHEEEKNARGLTRKYSEWNLFQCAIVRELKDIGFDYYAIRILMDRYFKNFSHTAPLQSVRTGLARREGVLAAESGIMDEVLIFAKPRIGRGWRDLHAYTAKHRNLKMSKFIPVYAGLFLLDLSVIKKQVLEKVKEAGLDK